jgi:flagellar assembly protein FliH
MNVWNDTLNLPRQLRGLLLLGPEDAAAAQGRAAAEEESRASYQRGWDEAEKAMGQQLLQQRTELHQLMPQVVRETENTLITLALAAAQKLVADLPISAELVAAVVRDALAQVEGAEQFTVRLHPADLELLQKAASPLLAPENEAREFRFVASPDVTRGGCLVQTRFGTVDARRETKMDLLQNTILG